MSRSIRSEMDDPPPSAFNPSLDDPPIPSNVQAHPLLSDIIRADSATPDSSLACPLHLDPSNPEPAADDDHYDMANPRRGVAVIFNNSKYEGTFYKEREGSQYDVECLSRSFSRLGFDVETHTDLTYPLLYHVLEELRGRDHSDCDCFALIFMSHEDEDGRLLSHDWAFNTNLLWDRFTADRCPSLDGKPKLFFVVACIGSRHHKAVLVKKKRVDVEAPELVQMVPSYMLPEEADFLIALATTSGFYCGRDHTEGNWYVQRLCKHLDQYGFGEDLVTLLTRVAHTVAVECTYSSDETEAKCTQLPSIISYLTRALRFTEKRPNH